MNFFEVYFSGKYTVTMYQRKLRFTFNEDTQQLRYGNRSPKRPLEWLFDNTSIIRPIESEWHPHLHYIMDINNRKLKMHLIPITE